MRLAISLALVCSAACAVAAPGAFAASKDAEASNNAFEVVMAADRVAAYARAHDDFNAMMTAANMMLDVPMRDPEHPDAKPMATDGGYLAEARTMAHGDAGLIAQVNFREQQVGDRNVASSVFGVGLLRVVKDVDPHATYSVPIKAKPNELLRVGAIGGKSSPIALTLRDGKGKAVCTDDGANFSPVCQIQPGQATDFKVEVSNKGNATTRAIILSN